MNGHSLKMLHVKRWFMLVYLLMCAACIGGDVSQEVYVVEPGRLPAHQRHYPLLQLQPMLFAGGANDTLLASPEIIVADRNKVFVYDWASQQIVKFNTQGVIEARFGREGPGPGEFRWVTDLRLNADRTLHVLDTGNRRITVLNEELKQVHEIPLNSLNGQPQSAIPYGSGYLLYLIASDTPLVSISEIGEELSRHPLPWGRVRDVHWMAREGILLHDPDSRKLAYAFKYGNGWLSFKSPSSRSASVGGYLNSQPFPPVVSTQEGGGFGFRFATRPTVLMRGADLVSDCLYIVTNDRGTSFESIIDVFDAESARYLISYSVPGKIESISISGSYIYALQKDPFPGVLRIPIGTDSSLCGSAA